MDTLTSTKSAFARIAHGIFGKVFDGAHASQLFYKVQVASTIDDPKGAEKLNGWAVS